MCKCAETSCTNEAVYAWQPFGPDDSPAGSFTTLGSHYRGFPVLKVCQECRDFIAEATEPTTPAVLFFRYKGVTLNWASLYRCFQEAPF